MERTDTNREEGGYIRTAPATRTGPPSPGSPYATVPPRLPPPPPPRSPAPPRATTRANSAAACRAPCDAAAPCPLYYYCPCARLCCLPVCLFRGSDCRLMWAATAAARSSWPAAAISISNPHNFSTLIRLLLGELAHFASYVQTPPPLFTHRKRQKDKRLYTVVCTPLTSLVRICQLRFSFPGQFFPQNPHCAFPLAPG